MAIFFTSILIGVSIWLWYKNKDGSLNRVSFSLTIAGFWSFVNFSAILYGATTVNVTLILSASFIGILTFIGAYLLSFYTFDYFYKKNKK